MAASGRRCALALLACAGMVACQQPTNPDEAKTSEPGASPAPSASATSAPVSTTSPPPVFADAAAATGLDFTYWNGMVGEQHLVEMVGGGAALFDFDRDGDLDVWLVQGELLGLAKTPSDAIVPPPDPPGDRIFRNLMEPGRPTSLRFVDVTEEVGVTARGYGQGIAVGDVDNDGWPDVYLANYGTDQLWHNRGDGTFENWTRKAGIHGDSWSSSASFFDFDRDGWLDIYVGHYVNATLENHFNCKSDSGLVDYCGPLAFEPRPDVLLHNRGDGTFEDVTSSARVTQPGNALGVAILDADEDGWLDVYVANDQMDNFLWLNQRDGTFRNNATLAGVAFNGEGRPEASMGIVAADLDGDRHDDVFLTHLRNETNTFYRGRGDGLFSDATGLSGLGPPSLPFTSFGVVPVDVENDGDLDLLVANGTVKQIPDQLEAGDLLPLRQPNQLFLNHGDGRFQELAFPGESARAARVSRGVAVGDVDNDGDLDVLVINNSAPAQLLLSSASTVGSWIGFVLEHPEGLSGVLGATLDLRVEPAEAGAGAITRRRRARVDGSFLSANDPRVLFGLGASAQPALLTVHWCDGRVETFAQLEPRHYQVIRYGSGMQSSETAP